MKGYIEACVGRVIAALLSSPSLGHPKVCGLGSPVCVVAGVDTRYPGGLSRTCLVEEWGVGGGESVFCRPRHTLLCVHGQVTVDVLGSLGTLGMRVSKPSSARPYPHDDLVYHCEQLVRPVQNWLHDFTSPFRYRWCLSRPDGLPIYFEEIDYVLYRIMQDPYAPGHFLPGLLQQLGVLGGCDAAWVHRMQEILFTIHEKQTLIKKFPIRC